MYEDNLLVGKGLKLLFFSELAIAVSGILEGMLGSLLEFVALVLSLVALNMVRRAHPLFRWAFRVSAAQLPVIGLVILAYGLAGTAISLGIAAGILMMLVAAVTVLRFCVIYLVCTAAGQILSSSGFDAEAAKGKTAWKFCLVDMAVCLTFMAMAAMPSLIIAIGSAGALASSIVLSIVMGIIRLVSTIMYLLFLYNAYHALLRES